ncbi:MAG: antibiotic biosynthesis monooxygenase family protein [Chloroflexota bacterium]
MTAGAAKEGMMYSSITTIRVQPDQLDRAARAWQELHAAGRSPDGLQRAHFLVDRATGQVVIVGLWDTEQEARAFEQSDQVRQVREALRPFLAPGAGAADRRTYEVAASVGRGG